MYTRVIRHILENTRRELFGAALVFIYGGTYLFGYFALQILSSIIGWSISIDFNILNIFIGCIGLGELTRGLVKVMVRCDDWKYSVLTTSIAGAFCVGMFWVLMVFKWSHNSFSQVPVAALSGSVLYLVLAGLIALENRKKI